MDDNLVAEIQDDFLTCRLCRRMISQPKALPCLHSFCKSCLARLIHGHARGHRNEEYIYCPACNHICDIPPDGADGFKDHHVISNLLDTINSHTTSQCDNCVVNNEVTTATTCCITCDDFLCENCATNHKQNRVTKTHLIVTITSLKDLHFSNLSNSVKLVAKVGSYKSGLASPFALCTNKAGDILVSNGDQTISMFSSATGKIHKKVDQSRFLDTEGSHVPNKGVCLTVEGYVAVAMKKSTSGHHAHVALIQSLAGREVALCTVKCGDVTKCEPSGIHPLTNNGLVVTDTGRHKLYIFDSNFQLKKQIGKFGTGNKKFNRPYFVTVSTKGLIYVSDYGNNCIKVFDSQGAFKFKFGQMGRNPGDLLHPMGLCFDASDNLYVADRDNHRVQRLDARGNFQCMIIENSYEAGNDVRPQDVAMTTNGNLLVLLSGVEGLDFAQVHVYNTELTTEMRPLTSLSRATGPRITYSRLSGRPSSSQRLPPIRSRASILPPKQIEEDYPTSPPLDSLDRRLAGMSPPAEDYTSPPYSPHHRAPTAPPYSQQENSNDKFEGDFPESKMCIIL